MEKKKDARITIYDIAKKASVSTATVSKVLNNKGNVSEKTRNAIIKIAEENGYQPNIAAQYLKTKKTNQILLLIPNVTDPFFFDIIKEVQLIAKEKNYILSINSTDNDETEELRVLSNLNSSFFDGLVIISLNFTQKHYEKLNKFKIPVVLCTIGSRVLDNMEPIFDYIGVDTQKGIYMAVKQLIAQKHQSIGFAGISLDNQTGVERYKGYSLAMEEYGLPIKEEHVFTGKATQEFGYQVGMSIYKLDEWPTAICAAADIIVIGIYKAFQECGIRIPEDIAVIGMDDINIASMLKPSISSVNLAQGEMGKECAEILIKRINGDSSLFKSIVFQPKLIVRESCKGK